MSWPPTLDALKVDMRIDPSDVRDDERLQMVLDAAVDHVQRVRPDVNYEGDPTSTLTDVSRDLVLGTLRLAGRWHTRRRSPDGSVDMGDLGIGRVPTVDPDIERLLRIGRFAKPKVA